MTEQHSFVNKLRASHTASLLVGVLCGAIIMLALLDTFGLVKRGEHAVKGTATIDGENDSQMEEGTTRNGTVPGSITAVRDDAGRDQGSVPKTQHPVQRSDEGTSNTGS